MDMLPYDQNDAKVTIDNSQWAFADCSIVPFPGTPSTTKVCVNGGFDTNHIYDDLCCEKSHGDGNRLCRHA
jgi:hypothetical protein